MSLTWIWILHSEAIQGRIRSNLHPLDHGLAATPVGTESITVNLVDLFLSTKQPATISVVVSGVASLILEVKDNVEGASIIIATTTLLDSI